MKIWTKLLSFMTMFCLILALLLSTVDFWCFNKSFYHNEYQKLKQAEYIGMSAEDLDLTTDVLLSYLKDADQDLYVEAEVNGQLREVFNAKEKAHMADVLLLYQRAMLVRNIAVLVAVAGFLFIIINKQMSFLFQAFKKAILIYVIIFSVIIGAILIDFDAFWTTFHQLFFTNDLWLLNPRVDILVMMVPGPFFNDLCVRIIVTFMLLLLGVFWLFSVLEKKDLSND